MLAVDTAPFYPNACLCGNGTGPFIDTGIEKQHPFGHIYLCQRCVSDSARRFKWKSPEDADATAVLVAENAQQIADLELALAEEKMNKFVPLGEVVDFLVAFEKKHGHKPGEKPKKKGAA